VPLLYRLDAVPEAIFLLRRKLNFALSCYCVVDSGSFVCHLLKPNSYASENTLIDLMHVGIGSLVRGESWNDQSGESA